MIFTCLGQTWVNCWFWSYWKEHLLNSDLSSSLLQYLFLESISTIVILCLDVISKSKYCINVLGVTNIFVFADEDQRECSVHWWLRDPKVFDILIEKGGRKSTVKGRNSTVQKRSTFSVLAVTSKLNTTHDLFHQRLRASFMQIPLKSLTFILIKAYEL